jgi:hypothetical protein
MLTTIQIVISIRNPNCVGAPSSTLHLDFLEDTGSTHMNMPFWDKLALEQLTGANLPSVGFSFMNTAGGQISTEMVVVQANILVNGKPIIPNWIEITACVQSPYCLTAKRLSGVWFRHILWVWSQPDNINQMHIGNDMLEMLANNPLCDIRQALAPYVPFYVKAPRLVPAPKNVKIAQVPWGNPPGATGAAPATAPATAPGAGPGAGPGAVPGAAPGAAP